MVDLQDWDGYRAYMPEIAFVSPTEANGIWAVDVMRDADYVKSVVNPRGT
ncbi:MAG: hypothetical protein JF593_04030 [Novosphingobium sp.]|nr:hypothetical protein [Novosphingobium sp.]